MGNLKEISTRIQSVSSTQQITKAMKMVAASKLNKIQDKLEQVRYYSTKLKTIMSDVVVNKSNILLKDYLGKSACKKILIVAISSDKGLCGTFNKNILLKTSNYINDTIKNNKHVKAENISLMPIGSKMFDFFLKRKITQIKKHVSFNNNLSLEKSKSLAVTLINMFNSQKYDKIVIIYSKYKSISSSIPYANNFLPIDINDIIGTSKQNIDIEKNIHEPSQSEIVKAIMPQLLSINFYQYLLESNASENSSRMIAMNKATDNASDIIKYLNLNYNRMRQAAITQQIAEIVSATQALGA